MVLHMYGYTENKEMNEWMNEHVVSATVAEGGYKSKEEHQA